MVDAPYSRTAADREQLRALAAREPISGLLSRMELLYIVYPVEAFQRALNHLNPRLYSERLRIRRVSEGRLRHEHKRFVLFVFYGRESIPAFTQTVIDAIARRGLNLVISTNAKITAGLREALLEKSCLLIERADLGRDFGGYKDGISIIEKRFGVPDRLILLNDSLFFFEKGLDEFIERFDGDADLYAMTEVFEHHYHLGSFALSLGGVVLRSKRFRRYWKAYRPVSTRRWSIHKGEVGLTQTLMRAGFKPHVLYHGAKLLASLSKLDSQGYLSVLRLLPAGLRAPLYIQYDEFQENQRDATLSAIKSLSRGVSRLSASNEEERDDLREASVQHLLRLNHEAATNHLEQARWVSKNICRETVATVTRRNQMHAGGFLFRHFLGMPGIKRDIFYREAFRLEEIDTILADWKEPLREAVMADLRHKGTQAHLKGLARILVKHGSI